MTKPYQKVAAAIVFHGLELSPWVAPINGCFQLPCERETKLFRQLTAYMASFPALETIGEAWQPVELFTEGAALSVWLRGGARYLLARIEEQDYVMPKRVYESDDVDVEFWYIDLQPFVDALRADPIDHEAAIIMEQVRDLYDVESITSTDPRKLWLTRYYNHALHVQENAGLESNPRKIRALRAKGLASV